MRCLDCHAVIPAKRLLALPSATRCVRCQSRHDERPTVNPDVLAIGAEGDDATRCQEWRDAA